MPRLTLLRILAFASAPYALACSGSSPHPDHDAGVICNACGACEETLPVASRLHVLGPVDYGTEPPVGGPHSQCWADWGVHSDVVPEPRWVHNLEHGGVVLLYHCEMGCDAERGQLADFVSGHGRTLLTEDPKLPARFAIVAWEHRLVGDCVDLAAYQTFYEVHVLQAPESISSAPNPECALHPDL
jgi:hypothetical protein